MRRSSHARTSPPRGTAVTLLRTWAMLLTFLAALGAAPGVAHADVSARALEARLYAPCCWGGTLDIHESELARDLRREIEARVAGGESTARIELDMVERFGERVVARRTDRPILWMSSIVLLGIALTAMATALMLRRWVRAGRQHAATGAVGAQDAHDRELDAQLDRELARMDHE